MTPRLTWLLAICGLLAANVVAMVVLAVAANNGGNQVIPAYYDKATHYDDEIDRSRTSYALGWHAEVVIASGAIDVVVSDRGGNAIDNATVRVTGYQRAHAADPLDVVLTAAGGGHYRAGMIGRRGWHDLTVVADRADAHYLTRIVVEVR
jgi:nitrogen fixation protein FixH